MNWGLVPTSGKSMVPEPSASTSLIMSWSSAAVGFCPRERRRGARDAVAMVPSRSVSKREKAYQRWDKMAGRDRQAFGLCQGQRGRAAGLPVLGNLLVFAGECRCLL
jgi:hypothetical protein